MLVSLIILEDDFRAQGEVPYKAIHMSRLRKPLWCWCCTSPWTVIKTMDSPWWSLELMAEARSATDHGQAL